MRWRTAALALAFAFGCAGFAAWWLAARTEAPRGEGSAPEPVRAAGAARSRGTASADRPALRRIVRGRPAAPPDAVPLGPPARAGTSPPRAALGEAPAPDPAAAGDLAREVGAARAAAQATGRAGSGPPAAPGGAAPDPRETLERLLARIRASADPAARDEIVQAYLRAAQRLPPGDREEAIRALRARIGR